MTVLAEMGALLYGPTWQSDVARLLGVSPRTVRRWAAGQWPLPPARLAELEQALLQRLEAIRAYVAVR